ncbi:hypothetical protein EST38_g7153 [Candolleomyces aberdarensis]|uniref:Integral membrane protein n=1 Tax=Candolleomyces aberdarensis TaxID=2316362 RepID=A0A4Q2DFZ4_9AGAR|nr:hypothetical protein EST38_g7153 [Candolleomyces aberdarensis]
MSPTYVPNDSLEQVCFLTAALVETGVYGVYASLFILNFVYTACRREVRDDTRLASKPFFWALIVMFMLVTFHEFLILFRVIRAYGLGLGADGTPLSYLRQYERWDNIAHAALLGIIICFGDALVIYRCYIVWGYKLWVVALPILLFLITVGIALTLDVWFTKPFTSYDNISLIVDFSYPINLAQNVLTTGLITLKILKQYHLSSSTGLVSTNRVSLITVTRIMVESASIYTVELLFLIILYFANSPGQFIVQSALIPSIAFRSSA